MPFERGVDHKGKFKPGVSGNPAGKPKGAKNKLTLIKEAAQRGEGLSPAEMMMEIARRNYAQGTSAGDAMALKAIIEANKYIEPTANAKENKKDVKEMSDKDLEKEVLKLVSNDKKK